MNKKDKGFTLIELITVLILLGILMAISTPKFTELTTNTKNKVAQKAITSAKQLLREVYNKELLQTANPSTAWSNTIANIPANCGVADQDFTVVCTGSGDIILITATGNSDSSVSGGTASGNFTNPEN